MSRKKTLYERALFKQLIHKALYQNEDIKKIIIGDLSEKTQTEIMSSFKKHVKSHLFVEETIKDAGTYIFYDVMFPRLGTNIKTCRIIMYAICQRDTLEDNSSEKYPGDKIDALSQMIEDSLINDDTVVNKFGIGELNIDSIDIYNSNRFYGNIFVFNIPNFR